ncbi:MAG: GNAT family N-acetyltransferase [Sphingomonas sp.]|jgi:acetyltransferase
MNDIAQLTQFATRSGVLLDVRPACEADEAMLAEFFDDVSEEDRRFRFLSAAPHISQDQLAALTHADHVYKESYLAFDHATNDLVASGLIACDEALDTAEVAVSIRRDYRGKGVGWAMLGMLADEARARGVRRVISIESRENHAAIDLERERGFAAEACDGDPTLVVLSKAFR